MLGAEALILRVRIPNALAVTKVDTAWFNAYVDDCQEEFVRNYWRSVPFDASTTTWEYLVEGMIEADDPEGLEYLRKHGAHLDLAPNPAKPHL